MTLIIIILALFYKAISTLPSYEKLAAYYPPSVNNIYSSDGMLIEQFGMESRVFIPIDNIPEQLMNAFIATEDQHFYSHPGLDYTGIIRAILSNFKHLFNNHRLEGGSTITQQVVKNLILTSERSIMRKTKEAILSYMISKTFSKRQILEIYLNQIYLGEGSYGIASASYNYFGKSVDDLTLSESAMIASLAKAPSRDNPVKNYSKALQRRNYVLQRMYKQNYITKTAYKKVQLEKLVLKTGQLQQIYAPYYAQIIHKQLDKIVPQALLDQGGLSIFTSMNSKYQHAAEQALQSSIKNFNKQSSYKILLSNINVNNWQHNLAKLAESKDLDPGIYIAIILEINDKSIVVGLRKGEQIIIPIEHLGYQINPINISEYLSVGNIIKLTKQNNNYVLYKDPQINGSLIAINPNNGDVLAEIGGYSFKESNFDRAVSGYRQIGSLVKTLVYLAAFENNIPPNAIFTDEEIAIEIKGQDKAWIPRNWYKKYKGDVTLRTSYEKSINIIAVKIIQKIGIPALQEIIKRLSVHHNPPKLYSLSLGALESSLEKITNSYAMIANGGLAIQPTYIQFIQDRKGNIIYTKDDTEFLNDNVKNPQYATNPIIIQKEKKRLIDEASSFQTISLLKGSASRGTSSGLKVLGIEVGGKTGTTNSSKDNWFIGVSPNIVVGTYMGYDIPKSLGENIYSSSTTVPMYINFMKKIRQDFKNDHFKIPDTILTIKIDPATGKHSNDSKSIDEFFKVRQMTIPLEEEN